MEASARFVFHALLGKGPWMSCRDVSTALVIRMFCLGELQLAAGESRRDKLEPVCGRQERLVHGFLSLGHKAWLDERRWVRLWRYWRT